LEALKVLNRILRLRILVLPFLAVLIVSPVFRAQAPTQDYLVYVVCESADKLVRLRFTPGPSETATARIDHEAKVGLMPTDINGPHGIAISPDRQYVYVSVGHGLPYGSVWKYKAGADEMVRFTSLGLFPATTDITHDGKFIYVANANFHGDMVPSSISVVATDPMIEVKRITTCTMPHGSRLNPQGTKHYSVCMMNDMLVEIDTASLEVSRHFMLTAGKEMGMNGPAEFHAGAHTMAATCVPTWAQPSNDGSTIYVACNKSNEIIAIDAKSWTIARRFPAATGVYNLAMTKDGRVVATNKRGQSVSIFNPETGKELARIPTKRQVVHGAVVSPDDHYAFISEEGIGAEPGTVEMIDLDAMKSIAAIDVGEQAGGIDFWKTEPGRP
jgi:DNA-binding beta-propeller fold protein YncE